MSSWFNASEQGRRYLVNAVSTEKKFIRNLSKRIGG